MWEIDPQLHEFIDKKVLILGEIIDTKSTITVNYSQIKKID
jgi:hypoxanthine phosphoribosyltransferase